MGITIITMVMGMVWYAQTMLIPHFFKSKNPSLNPNGHSPNAQRANVLTASLTWLHQPSTRHLCPTFRLVPTWRSRGKHVSNPWVWCWRMSRGNSWLVLSLCFFGMGIGWKSFNGWLVGNGYGSIWYFSRSHLSNGEPREQAKELWWSASYRDFATENRFIGFHVHKDGVFRFHVLRFSPVWIRKSSTNLETIIPIIPLLELRATPETSCLGVKFSVAGMNLKTPPISHKSSGILGQKNTEIMTHPRIYPWSRMVLISHMVKGVIGHPFWITPNILLKWSKRKSHCRPICHKTNVFVGFGGIFV